MRFTQKAANYVDERTSASTAVKALGRKIFPDHWSFMLGEVALYSFIVILISGTFLTFFYDPSMSVVEYEGSYLPLKGIEMSVAYHTALDISFDIRGGLLMRQVHHWAALLVCCVHWSAHASGVLHRSLPQAPRAELDRRILALRLGDGRRLHRLQPPRRPALR
jgi:quinol-cytochrome oxidoreductase complex cytochrome b subunit